MLHDLTSTSERFHAVAVLGIAGPGPKSSAGPLPDVFTCFPVISFQIFSDAGPLLGSKPWVLGPCHPKTITDSTLMDLDTWHCF